MVKNSVIQEITSNMKEIRSGNYCTFSDSQAPEIIQDGTQV